MEQGECDGGIESHHNASDRPIARGIVRLGSRTSSPSVASRAYPANAKNSRAAPWSTPPALTSPELGVDGSLGAGEQAGRGRDGNGGDHDADDDHRDDG